MARTLARFIVAAAVLLVAACGYEASAQFNADGSVTVGLEFLFPKQLLQAGSATHVQGFSAADIARANDALQRQYSGGKVAIASAGDEAGALITIPFKTEKEAFAFLTQPSKINPSGAASGTTPPSINLSQTGGLFATARHTTNGQTDTYTFTTQAATMPSPASGSQPISTDELASVFTITFTLTLPQEITSAPGALFTLDRKTAIWKMNWTKAETFTATTSTTLAGANAVAVRGQSLGITIGVGFVALAIGLLLGYLQPWRRSPAPIVPPASDSVAPSAPRPPDP